MKTPCFFCTPNPLRNLLILALLVYLGPKALCADPEPQTQTQQTSILSGYGWDIIFQLETGTLGQITAIMADRDGMVIQGRFEGFIQLDAFLLELGQGLYNFSMRLDAWGRVTAFQFQSTSLADLSLADLLEVWVGDQVWVVEDGNPTDIPPPPPGN